MGDGVRIIGQPGGTGYFTSINQLAVYFMRRIHLGVCDNKAEAGDS